MCPCIETSSWLCLHTSARVQKNSKVVTSSRVRVGHCACCHCSSLRRSAPRSSHSFHLPELGGHRLVAASTGKDMVLRRTLCREAPAYTKALRMSRTDDVHDGWQHPQFSIGILSSLRVQLIARSLHCPAGEFQILLVAITPQPLCPILSPSSAHADSHRMC